MANNRLTDSARGLNHFPLLSVENSYEALSERLFLSFEQLDALMQIAAQGDLSQHSERVLYHYLLAMGDQLEIMRNICEWLVSHSTPSAANSAFVKVMV